MTDLYAIDSRTIDSRTYPHQYETSGILFGHFEENNPKTLNDGIIVTY